MKMSCLVLGTLCLCYYLLIVSYAGIKAAFSPIWLALAIAFYLFTIGIHFNNKHIITIPFFAKILFAIVVILSSIVFLIVEGIIIKNGVANPKPNADYMIILGAKVNGTVPSKTLRARVYGTKEYLEKNKNTKVIVSGGQGNGEDVTEAFAMKELLINMGISESRIYMEEKSTNTEENIRFSKAIIEQQVKKEQYEVVVATSDFHIYRGISLAKKQGIANVSGCPSKPDKILMVHYYFREFFAVVKDKLVGNI
ncbi:MAG: YdcF family protein [Clostridiales bacterium]|nr:YdcF family protein [Clostridiales bacterium]